MGEIESARALIAKKNPEIMKLRQQGFDEGRNEGRDEGRDEAQRNMLFMLLETRFGKMPVSVRKRLDTASSEQVMEWAKKVFSASSPMAVVGLD
jgi:flagellar biosynthesis/type III secretory pathway protein FliH